MEKKRGSVDAEMEGKVQTCRRFRSVANTAPGGDLRIESGGREAAIEDNCTVSRASSATERCSFEETFSCERLEDSTPREGTSEVLVSDASFVMLTSSFTATFRNKAGSTLSKVWTINREDRRIAGLIEVNPLLTKTQTMSEKRQS